MKVTINSCAKLPEIEAHPQATEPSVAFAEAHYFFPPSPQSGSDKLASKPRVMNPSKPTSFRNKIQITRTEIVKYFGCPQRLAAQKLGVSLSTLKRRYYKMGLGRWPHQLSQDNRRRSVWHMVNEVEPKSEKELSPDTVQTLTRLFSMPLPEQQRLATAQYSFQRNLKIHGNQSPNFKFLHYVPREPQPQSQSSIPSSSSTNSVSTNTKGIRKRPRRFLQLNVDTINRSPRGGNKNTQTVSCK